MLVWLKKTGLKDSYIHAGFMKKGFCYPYTQTRLVPAAVVPAAGIGSCKAMTVGVTTADECDNADQQPLDDLHHFQRTLPRADLLGV